MRSRASRAPADRGCDEVRQPRGLRVGSSFNRSTAVGFHARRVTCFGSLLFFFIFEERLMSSQLTGKKKPSFGSGDEALAVSAIVVRQSQLLFSLRSALGRCKHTLPFQTSVKHIHSHGDGGTSVQNRTPLSAVQNCSAVGSKRQNSLPRRKPKHDHRAAP